MKKTGVLILLILVSASLFSQTIIKMKRQGGVSIIPCKVNGLDLELIFDTGASDVSISLTEADSMFENGELTKGDIIGTSNYVNANGDITEGIVINIKEIEIAGLKMRNIKASVVKNLDAPLLLGQTAISKLGKIQLDLNNNTLTILNGKGTYDYSTYSLTDKLDNYYKDFSIVKIEKKDNNEGVAFSYTIPKKWKEQKVTNPVTFRNYLSDEYPYGVMYELRIGLQTLPALYNTYDSCEKFVNYVNNLNKNVDPTFKVISISDTKISFCKTIKNITFSKEENFNKLSIRYWIFCGNKYVSFIYTAYSTDLNKITAISDEFNDFCTSQLSNVIVYSALENIANCTIQSNAIENKTNISIVIKNACHWFKSENQTNTLNLTNNRTSSSLSFDISTEGSNLLNLDNLSNGALDSLRNYFNEDIKSKEQMLDFEIVTMNNKKYIYFKAKSKGDNVFVLRDTYIYVHNKLFIMIRSGVGAMDENDLKLRYKETHSDVIDLLNSIEYIGESILNSEDYYNKGVDKVQVNDFKGAIVEFNMAIKLNPSFTAAYYNRGTANFKLQDYKSAIDDFTKAIKINPDLMQPYYNRGLAKFKLEDYQGAWGDFNKAIKFNPDYADAYLNRGLMEILLGKKESGCVDLNKASSLGSVKANQAIKVYCK